MKPIVISSGSGVLKYKAGKLVDAFDVVIRCNHGFPCNAPRFYDFIGAKTNYCALNCRFIGDKNYRNMVTCAENYEAVEGIIAANFEMSQYMYKKERLQEIFPGKSCAITSLELAKEAHLGTGFHRSSCGLLALLYAAETYGEAWCYGFEPERGCRHFYDETRFDLTCPGIGNFRWLEVERDFMRTLPNIHFLEDELQ